MIKVSASNLGPITPTTEHVEDSSGNVVLVTGADLQALLTTIAELEARVEALELAGE